MERGKSWLSVAVFSNVAWATVVLALIAGPLRPQPPESFIFYMSDRRFIQSSEPKLVLGTRDRLDIPRLLHHVHIGSDRPPAESLAFVESCRLHYSERAGWRYMFWNETAAVEFIKRVDPGFLESFRSYPRPVSKADAIRPYIMKHLGGLYLDSDTECWREGSDMLEGYDVVLQGHHPGEALANGMMASVPNHPFWNLLIEMMKERRAQANVMDLFGVLNATGPLLLRDAVLRYFDLPPIGPHDLVRIPEGHPRAERFILRQLGSWFIPCVFLDKRCIANMMVKRAVGRAPLDVLAGMHHYSVGWVESLDFQQVDLAEREFERQVCNATAAAAA